MIWTFVLALISIVLLSGGQTAIKYGLNSIGGVNLSEGIVGFVLYGISAILWLDVLSKLDFSLAFPMVALTYVFTLLIGRFFFGEAVGWERILGVMFIIIGVIFLVRSGNQSG